MTRVAVVRKNSIRLPSHRDAGTYLFDFQTLGNSKKAIPLTENTSQRSGNGSRKLAGHEFLRTSANSTCKWHKRIHLGTSALAAELSVKLGIDVSPRTVRAYWPPEPERRGHRRTSSQSWKTFVRNHAQFIVACDSLVVVTARFRTLYVFLLMEFGTRRIVHCNITAHPTAGWTLQQLREAIPGDHSYRFLIRDRDSIFSAEVDQQLKAFGREELRGHRALIASPYLLMPVRVGRPVLFACGETNGLGKNTLVPI